MDNRTGFRGLRGPAYHAAQARRALRPIADPRSFGGLPLPLVHIALGLAASAVLLLIQPGVMPAPAAAVFATVVAVATAAALILYDRLVYAAEIRPGWEGAALPTAAIAAFATVLIAGAHLPLRLAAAAASALIIAVVPQLAGLRAVGREGRFIRLARDAAGLVVLIPLLVAAVSATELSLSLRCAAVAAAVTLVSVDGLRSEALAPPRALGGALVVGVVLGGATAAASHWGEGSAASSASLLLLWYLVRGSVGGLAMGRRPVWVLAEYGAVTIAALVALRIVSR